MASGRVGSITNYSSVPDESSRTRGWYYHYKGLELVVLSPHLEFYTASSDLADGRITALTIGAWTDGNGQLTKFVITAKSAEESVNIVETFTACNRPLTITAPHAR
jgi:hypothetical protein